MKIILFEFLKFSLRIIYAPIKLFKTKNRIVWLSRQSNDKSIDMRLLEKELKNICPDTEQVFRLRMVDESFSAKVKYFFSLIGDMYYLSTSRVALTDTYSITVSCLSHKESLKVVQVWHALGAVKMFGYQSLGKKEGRDELISRAMCMHENYDYILAPSKATAMFYMEAFGDYKAEKMKICSLPRVDELLTDNNASARFFKENPDLGDKKLALYLPTFRDREMYVAQKLKVEFEDMKGYRLIVSTHPLSKVRKDPEYSYNGDFSTYDLMKVADIIITDYSACAFEASVLMKPLYFFVPDYEEYSRERGLNINLYEEMGEFTFDNAEELCKAIRIGNYDFNKLFKFKSKYVENTKPNNTQILAKFISMLIK